MGAACQRAAGVRIRERNDSLRHRGGLGADDVPTPVLLRHEASARHPRCVRAAPPGPAVPRAHVDRGAARQSRPGHLPAAPPARPPRGRRRRGHLGHRAVHVLQGPDDGRRCGLVAAPGVHDGLHHRQRAVVLGQARGPAAGRLVPAGERSARDAVGRVLRKLSLDESRNCGTSCGRHEPGGSSAADAVRGRALRRARARTTRTPRDHRLGAGERARTVCFDDIVRRDLEYIDRQSVCST